MTVWSCLGGCFDCYSQFYGCLASFMVGLRGCLASFMG